MCSGLCGVKLWNGWWIRLQDCPNIHILKSMHREMLTSQYQTGGRRGGLVLGTDNVVVIRLMVVILNHIIIIIVIIVVVLIPLTPPAKGPTVIKYSTVRPRFPSVVVRSWLMGVECFLLSGQNMTNTPQTTEPFPNP